MNGSGDGDADGLADLLEYLLGSSLATNSASQLPTTEVQQFSISNDPGDYLTLSYKRAAGTGDLNVICQTATNLDTPNWTPNAILVSRAYNVDGTETYLFRSPIPLAAQPRQFMRIRVSLP